MDGEGFFLSPYGKQDSLKELEATLLALERGGGSYGKLQQPIDCAFPLRKAFLEKALQRKFPSSKCEKLEEFRGKLDPSGAALVFATAYSNNPASMFGHSFLKIYSKKNQSKSGALSLLDWSINYAAQVPEDENGFAFAYFGLTGGYLGQFALVPFYSKIEEYGYLEGRDIWEYELNLTPEELNLLVSAVWEIETNSHFEYYFFDENCSLQVLTLLEVIKPYWNLSSYFLHVIPGESIKKVARMPEAIKSVKLRPSLERKLSWSVANLSAQEQKEFHTAREGGDLKGVSSRALHSYLLFLQAEKKRKGDKWLSQERFRQVLVQKSRSETFVEPQSYGGESTRPDFSHGPYQIGLGGFYANREKNRGLELSLRVAYHDLLDSDKGYLPHSEILFPNFRFRVDENKFSLHSIEAFSLVSLTPWNMVRKPLAWRARAAYGSLLERSCGYCKGFSAEGAVGAAWGVLPEKVTLWWMLGGKTSLGENYRGPVARPFLEMGFLLSFPWNGKLLWESRTFSPQRASWKQDWKLGLSQSVGENWAVRWENGGNFSWKNFNRHEGESRISALRYF